MRSIECSRGASEPSRETAVASEADRSEAQQPEVAASPAVAGDACRSAGTVDAAIGYEAADPSLFLPQWCETLHRESTQRDR
jgi:hypothetical protein